MKSKKQDRGNRNELKKSVRSCKLTPNILAQKVIKDFMKKMWIIMIRLHSGCNNKLLNVTG